MNLKRIFITLTLIFLILPSIAHSQDGSIEQISFAHGVSASRTTILTEAENRFESKNYDSIILLLESSSIADRFVGAILCSLLLEDEKIELTKEQKRKIEDIEKSDELLKFRYGCTCNEVMSLSEYFSGKNPCDFRKYMKKWKKRLVEMYY